MRDNDSSSYTIIVIIWSMILGAVAIAAILNNKEEPKYVYPVRENIVHNEKWTGWEQYCFYEYANGHIDKKFIENVKIEGTEARNSDFETSLCPSKGVVTLENR